MTAALGVRSRPDVRVVGLDRLRGLAVLLMVADHLWAVSGSQSALVVVGRLTVTRAALPLFAVAAAAGLAGGLGRRSLWRPGGYVAAGVALGVLVTPALGLPRWDVLAVFGAVLMIYRAAPEAAWPLVGLVGLVQAVTWPVGDGYQPGLLAGLVAVGLLAAGPAVRFGELLPGRWLGVVGRHAAPVYVGHLLLLFAVVSVR